MPPSPRNPAIQAFIKSLGTGDQLGQIIIQAKNDGYEIRHHIDQNQPADSLRTCSIDELREIIATDISEEFRPLKSAPDLRNGWPTVSQVGG